MSYVLLDDGSRQILRFLFPGDMIGMSASMLPRVARDDRRADRLRGRAVRPAALIATLVAEHPRLAALIMALQPDRARRR